MADVIAELTQLSQDINVFYSLVCGSMIFMLQCGFAMLCAGSVRQKNAKNIMLHNILDACGGAFGYFFIGYALAYGTGGDFVGTSGEEYLINGFNTGEQYIHYFFQWTFAATAATIVVGTVAERCKMEAYFCYSFFLTAFVYPVIAHSVWNADGFLSADNEDPFRGVGMIDFAGSGVVHVTGGATSLVAALILGPRIGRFYDTDGNPLAEPNEIPPHSVTLQVLGTFLLWFGWYGFNPGSTLSITGKSDIAALCAITTTMAGAAGCLGAMFTDTVLGMRKNGTVEYDITMAMNGTLSGLVAITGGCSVVTPWAAVIIGLIGGWLYVVTSSLLIKFKIDDAVDAIPVHFCNGIWGCIATGLFAEPSRTLIAFPSAANSGLFYSWGNGGFDANLLLAEIVGILWISGWVFFLMTPFFYFLQYMNLFRVDVTEEIQGLDVSIHKGGAYGIDLDLSSSNKPESAAPEEAI